MRGGDPWRPMPPAPLGRGDRLRPPDRTAVRRRPAPARRRGEPKRGAPPASSDHRVRLLRKLEGDALGARGGREDADGRTGAEPGADAVAGGADAEATGSV